MSHRRDAGPIDCKVYVGDLGQSGTKHELERAFGAFGPLRNVWVARNPAGFAFVEFEDPRDAKDAVDALDGRYICGRRVLVEMSHDYISQSAQPLASHMTVAIQSALPVTSTTPSAPPPSMPCCSPSGQSQNSTKKASVPPSTARPPIQSQSSSTLQSLQPPNSNKDRLSSQAP
ncbi:sequence-specific mRNA binding [Branchiostoma belcheri]|nr:sequence-specific mRNA binding [Branchiostoma belcheri]